MEGVGPCHVNGTSFTGAWSGWRRLVKTPRQCIHLNPKEESQAGTAWPTDTMAASEHRQDMMTGLDVCAHNIFITPNLLGLVGTEINQCYA